VADVRFVGGTQLVAHELTAYAPYLDNASVVAIPSAPYVARKVAARRPKDARPVAVIQVDWPTPGCGARLWAATGG
jgi:hypothetical protein